MATTSLINTDACNHLFKTELNKSIHDAAEPIVQKALKDIERKMRELVDNSLSPTSIRPCTLSGSVKI